MTVQQILKIVGDFLISLLLLIVVNAEFSCSESTFQSFCSERLRTFVNVSQYFDNFSLKCFQDNLKLWRRAREPRIQRCIKYYVQVKNFV